MSKHRNLSARLTALEAQIVAGRERVEQIARVIEGMRCMAEAQQAAVPCMPPGWPANPIPMTDTTKRLVSYAILGGAGE